MTLFIAVLSGFLLSIVSAFLGSGQRKYTGWFLASLPAGLTLFFLSLLPNPMGETPITSKIPWVPTLGITLSFRTDGLALLFALLICGIGTLVVLYANDYLKGDPRLNRFYAWLFMFMASMLGVVLADNLMLLFVFWELTSLSSFLLIGFNHEEEASRSAALQALLVTGAGGLVLLAGLVLLGRVAGSFEVSTILRQGEIVTSSPLYGAILLLVLVGAFTKSAQFPFHFWLPNAMQAPTPVSAYLHSATMVKAGIYLLARLNPVLGGTPQWFYSVAGIGAATMLVGGFLALSQTDLKRLLAYSTVNALGMSVLLIGLGTPLAVQAAIVLLLAHAFYKGALFLVAGAVDHESGCRDVTQLGGLSRWMPITAFGAGLAALSMAGLPPTLGFISKELFYETGLKFGPGLATAAMLAATFNVYVAGTVAVEPFWGARRPESKDVHEATIALWLGPMILAGLGLIVGLVPSLVDARLVFPAVVASLGRAEPLKLALWHGINPAFLMSLATVGLGVGMYAARHSLRRAASKWAWHWGAEWVYARTMDGIVAFAGWQTKVLQSGFLRTYLLTIVFATLGLVGATLIYRSALHWPQTSQDVRFYEVALAVLIVGATWVAIRSRSRLGAIAALGITGYSVALLYLIFGAPDLAMTQFLIESLTVILFVFAFYHLPHFVQLTSTATRAFHALIALLAGGLMSLLVLSAVGIDLYPSISEYYTQNALPLAHGRNIVNVILVDFRGLDTLGEITVLAIAATGVYALLTSRLGKQK